MTAAFRAPPACSHFLEQYLLSTRHLTEEERASKCRHLATVKGWGRGEPGLGSRSFWFHGLLSPPTLLPTPEKTRNTCRWSERKKKTSFPDGVVFSRSVKYPVKCFYFILLNVSPGEISPRKFKKEAFKARYVRIFLQNQL